MTPEKALEILAVIVMKKVNATGEEHSVLNQALNAIKELIDSGKKEEK